MVILQVKGNQALPGTTPAASTSTLQMVTRTNTPSTPMVAGGNREAKVDPEELEAMEDKGRQAVTEHLTAPGASLAMEGTVVKVVRPEWAAWADRAARAEMGETVAQLQVPIRTTDPCPIRQLPAALRARAVQAAIRALLGFLVREAQWETPVRPAALQPSRGLSGAQAPTREAWGRARLARTGPLQERRVLPTSHRRHPRPRAVEAVATTRVLHLTVTKLLIAAQSLSTPSARAFI